MRYAPTNRYVPFPRRRLFCAGREPRGDEGGSGAVTKNRNRQQISIPPHRRHRPLHPEGLRGVGREKDARHGEHEGAHGTDTVMSAFVFN